MVLLTLLLCVGIIRFSEASPAGTISGRVMIDEDIPMGNGQVFIFNDETGAPPSFDRYWRVPDEIVTIDARGGFKATLPDGSYYLGAIKRRSYEEIGPLQEGDLFLPFYANGAPIKYTIVNGSRIDLGVISGAAPFRRSILKTGEGITAIEGVVADEQGKPIENVLVTAFANQSLSGRPLFISEKTGKDGRYLLRVYKGGSYYLKIRNSYGGGAIKTGEITGSYGPPENPSAVTVSTGNTVRNINISGTVFTGKGPKK
jgi:hypothetical protein